MRIKENKTYYIIVRQNGLAYAGMKHGKFTWTHEWDKAKPLEKDHTQYVMKMTSGCELIKEEEV